jgi:hypothetical protein
MEIIFNEREVLEIVKSQKSRKFEVNDIDKLYVTYGYCIFFKMYYLKIKTKNGKEYSINIDRKYKSRIKREINHFRILMNWEKMLNHA